MTQRTRGLGVYRLAPQVYPASRIFTQPRGSAATAYLLSMSETASTTDQPTRRYDGDPTTDLGSDYNNDFNDLNSNGSNPNLNDQLEPAQQSPICSRWPEGLGWFSESLWLCSVARFDRCVLVKSPPGRYFQGYFLPQYTFSETSPPIEPSKSAFDPTVSPPRDPPVPDANLSGGSSRPRYDGSRYRPVRALSVSHHLRAIKKILQDAVSGTKYPWSSETNRVDGLRFEFAGSRRSRIRLRLEDTLGVADRSWALRTSWLGWRRSLGLVTVYFP